MEICYEWNTIPHSLCYSFAMEAYWESCDSFWVYKEKSQHEENAIVVIEN